MRSAVCRLIEAIAFSKMRLAPKTVKMLLVSLDEHLRHPTAEIQDCAVAALRQFTRTYMPSLEAEASALRAPPWSEARYTVRRVTARTCTDVQMQKCQVQSQSTSETRCGANAGRARLCCQKRSCNWGPKRCHPLCLCGWHATSFRYAPSCFECSRAQEWHACRGTRGVARW